MVEEARIHSAWRYGSNCELRILETPVDDGRVRHNHYTIVDHGYDPFVIGFICHNENCDSWYGVARIDDGKTIVVDEESFEDAADIIHSLWCEANK